MPVLVVVVAEEALAERAGIAATLGNYLLAPP